MVTRSLTVANPAGIHLRPAGLLAKETAAYRCSIYICHNGQKINAKSVLKLMAAGIRCGDRVELSCDGADEKAALEAIAGLIEGRMEF